MESSSGETLVELSDKDDDKYSLTYAEKVLNQFDLTEGIHNTSHRAMKIILGMNLRLITNTKNDYCLVCRKIVPSTLENCLDHLRNREHTEYLDNMENDDKEIEFISEDLSELALAHEYMEIVSEMTVQCVICFQEMKNENSVIKNHMNDSGHKDKWVEMRLRAREKIELIATQIQCDWYNVQKYECVSCSTFFDFEIDFVDHLLRRHSQTYSKENAECKYQIVLDSCSVCALLWCTDSSSETFHTTGFMHRWFSKNEEVVKPQFPEAAKELLYSLQNYEDLEALDILNDVETQCVRSIEEALEKRTGYNYNVQFDIESPLDDAKFVRFLTKINPSYGRMMSFLKSWLTKCDLAGPEQIPMVTLFWYLTMYFQTHGMVPSMVLMHSIKKFLPKLGMDTKDPSKLTEDGLDIKEHVIGFFRLYAKFDYRSDIACPLIGKIIKKRSFVDGTLPYEMESYVMYMNNAKYPAPFKIDSVMCLQDPFDLQNNLTKFVKKTDLCRFRSFCITSLDILNCLETQSDSVL